MSIKDSLFDSPNYASILYATSSLDLSGNGSETGDTTYIAWDNNTVVNCSKATLMWTSGDNDIDGIIDGLNGNVALNFSITNSEFNSAAIYALFGS